MPNEKIIRVTPRNNHHYIKVIGNRDPRGADNTISIWLDPDDRLHIQVLKADRCYRFKEVIEKGAFIEIIQE